MVHIIVTLSLVAIQYHLFWQNTYNNLADD